MATPTGTIDSRRLSPNLNLSGNRHGRPQLRTMSMPGVARPAAARPASARCFHCFCPGPLLSPAASQGSAQPIPPGAAASSTAVSSAPPQTYVRRTEDALLRAPARLNQPHLHPRKLNGALWSCYKSEILLSLVGLYGFQMIDEGLEEPLSYPDLVRKTHSNADGSFIDKRAEALRAQTSKGNIYGLGSVQYQTTTTSKSVPASLKRSLDMEIRMCGVETVTAELKADFSALRSDFNEGMSSQKATLDLILQTLQPQASVPPASTT
ncbi:hypothetical protein Bca101_059027 [Brassica carinata]